MTASDAVSGGPAGDGATLATPRTNTLAIVALSASALSLLGIASIVGVGLGVVALNQISVRGEKGRGLACAAIFVGAVTLLASMIVIVMGLTTW